MEDLVVFGAGGLGREVIWQIENTNKKCKLYNILGFIDDTPELGGQEINHYPIIGGTEFLLQYKSKLNVVICLGNVHDREKVYRTLEKNPNLKFPNIIADDVKYSDMVKYGKGCIVCNSSILTVNIKLGDFVVIGNACIVGHDAEIDDFVTLYPAVKVSGNVKIGRNTEIGVGTDIIQKKNIGKCTVVGAGAVVVDDIPDDVVAVGVPARVIKKH